jgi:Zn-dependent protease
MVSQPFDPADVSRRLRSLSTEGEELAQQADFPAPGAGFVPSDAPAPARSGPLGGLAAAGVIAVKLLTGAKAAKFLLIGASLWSIALVRPLPFAAALIYAIFVHESGHLLAMKRRGLKTSGIWFLPFLGAVAVAKQPFRSHGETYFVAIAGPVFGVLSFVPLFAAPFVFVLWTTHSDAAAWFGYASAAAFVNLFNLLPIGILDGGRIVHSLSMSLSRRMGFVVVGGGLVLCAALLAAIGSGILGVILLLSIFELLRSRKTDPLPPMSRGAVLGGTAFYVLLFVLFAFLAIVAASASKTMLTEASADQADAAPTPTTPTDMGCAEEGHLRSVRGAIPTAITFTNRGTQALSVYWLNYRGKRVPYAKLAPGQSYVQKTFVTHPWLVVSDPEEECRGIFLPAGSPGTVVIR